MFPLSDLDILILTEQTPTAALQETLGQFVQFLWDCGFNVGQSIRTLAECETEDIADITVATNLLEARYLIGNQTLFKQLVALVQQPTFWPAYIKHFLDFLSMLFSSFSFLDVLILKISLKLEFGSCPNWLGVC